MMPLLSSFGTWVALLVVGLIWAGCDAGAAQDDDACQAAAAHLGTCTVDLEVSLTGACDAAEARRVLDTDCEVLRLSVANPKADGAGAFAWFACQIGFFAACETPACDDDEGQGWPAEPDDCAAWLDYTGCAACEYYACRESVADCGEDGYYVGYGGRYCERFAGVTEPRVSDAAAAWLQSVRGCLVGWLEANVPYDATCDASWQQGTDSHAWCYVQTGFCELSLVDWVGIVHSIDVGDLPLRTVLATAHGCISHWFGS